MRSFSATLALLMITGGTLPAIAQESCAPACNSCASGEDATGQQCVGPCFDGCNSCCDNSCNERTQGCFSRIIDGLCYDDGCAYYSCKPRLFGVFAPSDTRFRNFISPMTNPVYFEDPRTLTEARAIFLNHWLPRGLGGSDIQVFAVQARAALTKRLSIIATKDGYIFSAGNGPPIDGWANVNLGLKYNLYADPERQQLLSIGTRYELVNGSVNALQHIGTGLFDIFMTGGTQVGELSHFVSAAGFRLPTDPYAQNDQFYWSFHVDRRLRQAPLYGLLEMNWYHWMNSGVGGIPGVGGLDLYNLGSSGVAGQNIVTGAIGAKYKLSALNEIGVAWEAPMTHERDVMASRLTADLILRY